MRWRVDHPMNHLEIIISTILLVRHSSTLLQYPKNSASAVDAYYIHACTEHLLVGAIHSRVSRSPCSHSYLDSIEEQVRPGYDKRMPCNAQFHYTAVDALSSDEATSSSQVSTKLDASSKTKTFRNFHEDLFRVSLHEHLH